MTLPRIAMYADLTCPFAYVIAYRLRLLREEYRGRLEIEHKSLALEYVNRQPTPKPVLDVELPILALAEPGLPYRPWSARESEWPVTVWPAFEAVACARLQNLELAGELAWAIRVAFFAESRCISMRHVLLELAEQVGLDMDRLTADFDGGACKRQVIEEARDGWERLRVDGSPTLVLPSDEQVCALGLPDLELDESQNHRPVRFVPAPCDGDACLDLLRAVLDRAIAEATA
jgi:predicted DsbA family dithiol-disulfide isomerase